MKHLAQFLLPGFFFPEETTKTIEQHDPALAVASAPDGAYCFTLYDTEEPPDLGPDFRVQPVAKNRSGRYYIGGTIHTQSDVDVPPTVLANMQGNNWDRVILCRAGNWQPFTDDDVLLDAPGQSDE